MKTKICTIGVAIASLLILSIGSFQAEDRGATKTLSAPGATNKARGTNCLTDLISSGVSDFREIYSDRKTLEERISAGVCIVDSELSTGKPSVVKLSGPTSLADVLRLTKRPSLENWSDRRRPRITVISKQHIFASGTPVRFAGTEARIGDLVVFPGDIVVVGLIHD